MVIATGKESNSDMPWHVGIDEAGYGPNLGPLLQCAVAFHVADDPRDLWDSLRAVVRRAGKGRDARLLIDDSKKVFGSAGKLKSLELGVLAALWPPDTRWPLTMHDLLAKVAPEALVELAAEPWFDPIDQVPVGVDLQRLIDVSARFHSALTGAGCSAVRAIARVTPPMLFNSLLDQRDNKAEVLALGLRWLIHQMRAPDDGTDRVCFAIDRQGGRWYHVRLLEAACPTAPIEIVQENDVQCIYRTQAGRELRWTFEVEADSRYFTVALASMAAKYLRELLMIQFNRFWQRYIPDLKPTAGYPTDAARFFAAIRPVLVQLELDERSVWRRK